MKTNSYNIYNENNYSEVLYHAVAYNEAQVKLLAKEADFDITGLEIEEIRTNVTDELHRPVAPYIKDARVY